jgi:hypothetical protein
MDETPLSVSAGPAHQRCIAAVAELLGRLRVDFAFVGRVARAAWLGENLQSGAVDALALLTPQQKNQVAMMASNRGFRLDRERLAATEELDLIPMRFIDQSGEMRVHILMASNALYGHMVVDGQAATADGVAFKVASAEDLALLLTIGGDEESIRTRQALLHGAGPRFDRERFNRKAISIGLPSAVIPQ